MEFQSPFLFMNVENFDSFKGNWFQEIVISLEIALPYLDELARKISDMLQGIDTPFASVKLEIIQLFYEEARWRQENACNIAGLWAHTYRHNWSSQPFSQDYDLASHTTYVSFLLECWAIQFKVGTDQQIFWLYMAIFFLLILRVFAWRLLSECRRKNF